jgi:hypothetical protein
MMFEWGAKRVGDIDNSELIGGAGGIMLGNQWAG